MTEYFPYDNSGKADKKINSAEDADGTTDNGNDKHTCVHKFTPFYLCFIRLIIMIPIKQKNRKGPFLTETEQSFNTDLAGLPFYRCLEQCFIRQAVSVLGFTFVHKGVVIHHIDVDCIRISSIDRIDISVISLRI